MRQNLVDKLTIIRSGWEVMRTEVLKLSLLSSVGIDGNRRQLAVVEGKEQADETPRSL
jgi:hypothetical protein